MAGSVTAVEPAQVPLHLDEVERAQPRRPRVLLIGTAFAAAGSMAVFVGLLGIYLSVRSQVLAAGEAWLPAGANIPLSPGNMSMVTLVMSLVTVQWAVHAGTHRDRSHAYMAMGLTLLFGVAHITQMAFLWTEWGVALNGADTTAQAVLLFTILGLQVAMTGGALIFLVLMLLRSLGGQFTGPDAEGLSAAALYWWTTVAVFSVLWYAILIVK